MKTKEGAYTFEHSLDHAVEFFSKAGSIFAKSGKFYEGSESALSLFQKTWIVDKFISMKLLFWLRDIRGGAGNRSAFREILKWLAEQDSEWVPYNIDLIPTYGRWDDLRSLFGTSLESEAAKLWAESILNHDVLAAKWADRKDTPILKYIQSKRALLSLDDKGMNIYLFREAEFRKLLSSIRKDHIVEAKMCAKQWNEVDYKSVPSVAMSRYTNAFIRHDEDRFNKYKESLKKGETKVNAGALFPHDCVRTVRYGDREIADAQFESLPNFIEDTNEKIIVISDTSGSMCVQVSGSVQAVDISQGLALYCSAKIPKENPFHKKFIGFCSEGEFKDWNGMTFSEAVNNRYIFDEAIGSTRIDKALDLILKTAKFFSLQQNQMPTMLLIVSDMQFHVGTEGDGTEIQKAMERWKEAGYKVPKIVYWNTAGYAGSPDTVKSGNTALISGFSPAILEAILSGTDFSPKAVMLRALEKYPVRVPK